MSNDKQYVPTFIKLENDSDSEDIINDKSFQFSNLSTTSTITNPAFITAYKGKIEVTSKGRRKIFDGVRWQILCKRPECRKQTNKKSLCITHYKEEYESNTWESFQQRITTNDKSKTRLDIEDQNNTITTTNLTETDEQISKEGQIEYMNNGRRFILKNNKWQLLCKYNNNCCNIAKNESFCLKHFDLTQKRRTTFKFPINDNRRLHSSIINNHHSIFSKRLKTSSSSIIEQFDINSHENNSTSTKIVNNDFSILTSKLPGYKLSNRNNLSSDDSLLNKQNSKHKTDQSVQTDITIPLCCIIHHEDHLFSSTCKKNN